MKLPFLMITLPVMLASACLPKPSSTTTEAVPADPLEACLSDPDACAGRCKKGDEGACRAQAVVFAEKHPKLLRWLNEGGMKYEDINVRPMVEAAQRMCTEGNARGCRAVRSLGGSVVGPTASDTSPTKRGCQPPATKIGPYCLVRTPGERSTVIDNLRLTRPDGTAVWSGEGTEITGATEEHIDVVTDFGGSLAGSKPILRRWLRKDDTFEPGPEKDLQAEQQAQEVENAWSTVESVGDDLAIKKFLHGFAVQHTTGARNARAAQRMVEHMAMITKDEYCPAVKDFVKVSSRAEFSKRAKLHCDDSPPTAGGLNGEQVECRNECRAVFATSCP